MDTNGLLIRTMKAAKEARSQGYRKTADAFDDIAESLLEVVNSQSQFSAKKQANSCVDVLHFH